MKTKIITLLGVVLIGIGLAGCSCDCFRDKGKDAPAMTQEAIQNEEASSYMTFTQERFDALRGTQKFVVFFYADWCGTCRKWDKNMRKTEGSLPADAMVLKIDYDTEKDLTKELQVTSQSTAVFFNEKGEVVETVMDPSMETIQNFFL